MTEFEYEVGDTVEFTLTDGDHHFTGRGTVDYVFRESNNIEVTFGGDTVLDLYMDDTGVEVKKAPETFQVGDVVEQVRPHPRTAGIGGRYALGRDSFMNLTLGRVVPYGGNNATNGYFAFEDFTTESFEKVA